MSAQGITGSSTSNGRRGPGRPIAADTIALIDGLEGIVSSMRPMSVRGAYYQASVRGLVTKTEAGYRKVQRVLVKMREAERIPWGWITDGTRTRYGVRTFDGAADRMRYRQHELRGRDVLDGRVIGSCDSCGRRDV